MLSGDNLELEKYGLPKFAKAILYWSFLTFLFSGFGLIFLLALREGGEYKFLSISVLVLFSASAVIMSAMCWWGKVKADKFRRRQASIRKGISQSA